MFSVQELRSSTKKELVQELEKARKEGLKIRINVKTKQEKDSSKALKTKRYVAQIMTVLKELESEEKSKSPTATAGQAKLEKSKTEDKKVEEKTEKNTKS